MARRSKKERKKAIDDLPNIPGGPFWRHLGPFGPAVPIIPEIAKELAKLMIDAERESTMSDEEARKQLRDMGFNVPELPEDPAITRRRQQEERWAQLAKPKKKRKVSDYSKQFGIILKALKKKHPRTPVTRLMKRAHVATRKKMPKKPKGRLSKGRRTIAKSGQFRRDKILPRRK